MLGPRLSWKGLAQKQVGRASGRPPDPNRSNCNPQILLGPTFQYPPSQRGSNEGREIRAGESGNSMEEEIEEDEIEMAPESDVL